MPNEQGCMLWLGALSGGYGQIRAQGQLYWAHRVAYELANGQIPEGMQIDHTCRVRGCVAPLHLEAVTQAENMRRARQKEGSPSLTTHCGRGHPYDDKNTYVWPRTGKRQCRACRRKGVRS